MQGRHDHYVVRLAWNNQGASYINLIGRVFTSINLENWEHGSSFDQDGLINGVMLGGDWQMLRYGPEDCVVNDTLVYAHIANIKNAFSDNILTVASVRLSETVDIGITDLDSRIEVLWANLVKLLNSTPGHHLFQEVNGKFRWNLEENRAGLMQPCLLLNGKSPLSSILDGIKIKNSTELETIDPDTRLIILNKELLINKKVPTLLDITMEKVPKHYQGSLKNWIKENSAERSAHEIYSDFNGQTPISECCILSKNEAQVIELIKYGIKNRDNRRIAQVMMELLPFILEDKNNIQFGLLGLTDKKDSNENPLATYLSALPENGLAKLGSCHAFINTISADFALEGDRQSFASNSALMSQHLTKLQQSEEGT